MEYFIKEDGRDDAQECLESAKGLDVLQIVIFPAEHEGHESLDEENEDALLDAEDKRVWINLFR